MPTQLLAPAKQLARLNPGFPGDRRCNRPRLHRRRNDALLLGSRPPSAPPNRTDDIDLRLYHWIAPISIFIKSRPLPSVDKLGHLPPPEVSQGLKISNRLRNSSTPPPPRTCRRSLLEMAVRSVLHAYMCSCKAPLAGRFTSRPLFLRCTCSVSAKFS
jgi:hypothetical protein